MTATARRDHLRQRFTRSVFVTRTGKGPTVDELIEALWLTGGVPDHLAPECPRCGTVTCLYDAAALQSGEGVRWHHCPLRKGRI